MRQNSAGRGGGKFLKIANPWTPPSISLIKKFPFLAKVKAKS